MHPDNWKHCWPPTWLIPYVYDLVEFYSHPPYSKEKEFLEKID